MWEIAFTGVAICSMMIMCEGVAPTFPSINDVLPCTDVAANCARNYYNIQKADQSSLDTLALSAIDVSTEAGTLLDTVTSLKTSASTLTDLIDPDNTRTNGGEVRQLSTGRKLVGITPFMGTLAAKIVASASKRSTDLTTLITSLKNGMDTVVRVLQDAKKGADEQILATSSKAQTDITAMSATARDSFQQMDAKLVSASKLFDQSQASGPSSTALGLTNAMKLEASDFVTTKAKLTDFYNQIAKLPTELDVYQKAVLADLATYQAAQELSGNQLSAARSSAFNDEVMAMSTKLLAQMRGIVTTSKTDPYYATSLTGYIEEKSRDLSQAVADKNATQQGQIVALSESTKALARSVSSSFQPILNELTALVTNIRAADTKFQTDTSKAIADASSAVTKSQTSFASFTTNMDSLWNTTGKILTGQTTTITTELLNQIGNMTQQAGAEVDRLNTLMVQAGTGALEADSVRQAILASSRTQVVSMIGSNEAAMNASFKTINEFMNKSSEEIGYILNVVKLISSDRASSLNATANSAISGVYSLINTTKTGANNLLASLVAGVLSDIAADFSAMNSTYRALNATASTYMNQSTNLVSAMALTNAAEFARLLANVNSSKSNLDKVINTTNFLAQSVGNISVESEANRVNVSNSLDLVWNNASSVLSGIWANVSSQFAAVKSLIERSGSNLGTTETALIASLAAALNNASSTYAVKSSAVSMAFDSLVTKLNTNNTLFESQISDLQTQLVDLKNAIDASYRSAGSQLQTDAIAAGTAAQGNISSYVDAAKAAVTANLTSTIANRTGTATSALSGFSSTITNLEASIGALTTGISALKNQPASMLARATELRDSFKEQLDELKSSILQLSKENDAQADVFQAKIASTFGSGQIDSLRVGIAGLMAGLDSNILTAETGGNKSINDGIAAVRDFVGTAASAVSLKSKDYQARIAALKNQTQADVSQTVSDAFLYMNRSYGGFKSEISAINASVYAKLNASDLLDSQLQTLQTQVVAVQTQVNNNSAANATQALIAKYGSKVAADVSALLANSQQALTQAQKDEVVRQLASANVGLSGAGSIAISADALAQNVQAAIDLVKTASGTATANTNFVKGRLADISQSANQTVQITSNDIAAIIAKYKDDSAATKDALKAQLLAAGKASASVQDAMSIWTSLKTKASQLTDDELENLSDLRDEVFSETDASVGAMKKGALLDIGTLKKSVADTEEQVTLFHDSNMHLLDAVVGDLDSVASEVGAEKLGYDKSVASLRGYVATMVNALNDRYTGIVAQASPFRNALETAAANDIAAMTR